MKFCYVFERIKNIFIRSEGSPAKQIQPGIPSTWPGHWLISLTSKSGEIVVTEETALRFSAVYACIKFIAGTIASLPRNVYTKIDNGREIDREHDQYFLLKASPNNYSTSQSFFFAIIAQACSYGNGYARIFRNPITGRPEKYEVKQSRFVTPFWDGNNDLWYHVNNPKGDDEIISWLNMIHLPWAPMDGIMSKSPIRIAADNIAAGIAATQFGRKFYENGSHLGGVIRLKNKLESQEAVERLRSSWKDKYAGGEKVGEIAVLEDDAAFDKFGMALSDAQFIETRKFQVQEIARIFGLPPDVIGDMGRATYSNVNHNAIAVVQKTLLPLITALESDINLKSFRQNEFGTKYFKIETKGLLRGDLETRAIWYKTLFYTSAISPNEIRALEDMNAYEGGDEFYSPTNMDTLSDVLSGNRRQSAVPNSEDEIDKLLQEMKVKKKLNGNHVS